MVIIFVLPVLKLVIGLIPKQGVAVMMGEGDHTWVETIIMDDNQYKIYQNQERALKNLGKSNKAEMLNLDKDERILYGPVSINNL